MAQSSEHMELEEAEATTNSENGEAENGRLKEVDAKVEDGKTDENLNDGPATTES